MMKPSEDSHDQVHAQIRQIMNKQLLQSQYEVVGVVPVPTHSDRMVRLKSLQEILEDFEDSNEQGTVEYLVQLRPRSLAVQAAPLVSGSHQMHTTSRSTSETIYLHSGKLNTSYLMKNADLLLESGDFALARNIYKTVLQSGEYPGTVRHRLGRCFEAEGKADEACTFYEESIAYNPSFDVLQRLASIYTRKNRDQQSAEVLERALQFKELSSSVRFELHKACGNAWTRARKSSEACRQFKKALEINPSADEIQANLGVLYLQENQFSEASRCFQDAIASNPENAAALSGLGSCYLAEGDKKSAHDCFAQSLRINIHNPSSIFFLVKCAYEIKSYSVATKIIEEYIQVAPVNANLLYSLAGLQFHLGKIEEARASATKILELQPTHTGALDLIARIEPYQNAVVAELPL